MSETAVIDGVTFDGRVNTDDATLREHIGSSIRRGHPQIKPQHVQAATVALVCGGPSLNDTIEELRDVVAAGAKVVTVNGAYGWCLRHNFVPSMQIVMDARPTNVRFLNPALPRCHYALASQCHPSLWDVVEGRPNVWIYHVGVNEDTPETKAVLDRYYLGQWHGIGGGTTVGTRAIAMLRTLGYVRFEVFGLDSCWMGDDHHAYAQAENATDQRLKVTLHPSGRPDLSRTFECAPWHMKQAEDFLAMVRYHGDKFLLNLHGDGMLAYALRSGADAVMVEHDAAMSPRLTQE